MSLLLGQSQFCTQTVLYVPRAFVSYQQIHILFLPDPKGHWHNPHNSNQRKYLLYMRA